MTSDLSKRMFTCKAMTSTYFAFLLHKVVNIKNVFN